MTGANLGNDETENNMFLSSDVSKTESIADDSPDKVKENNKSCSVIWTTYGNLFLENVHLSGIL